MSITVGQSTDYYNQVIKQQNMSQSAATGYIQTVTKERTRLEEINSQISLILQTLSGVEGRFDQLADRAFGIAGQAASNDPSPVCAGTIDAIDQGLREIFATSSRLSAVAGRLEKLV